MNWRTPTLKATFMPRISDNQIRYTVNNKDAKAATVLGTFFNSVYAPVKAAEESAS